jgi:hypothetical protein
MIKRVGLAVAAIALASLSGCSGSDDDGEARGYAKAACARVAKEDYRSARSLAHSAAWIDPRWNDLAGAADRLITVSTSTRGRGNEGLFRLKLAELNAECDGVQ